MKYFIDTNIFLRYFTDEHNTKVFRDCSYLIENIKLRKINAATSHLVMAEIAWTLPTSYNSSKTQVTRVLKAIETLNGLRMIDTFDTGAANKLFEDHSIKYIDALVASNPQIQTKKMVVVSYDKDFDKIGVRRREPSDIINRG